MGDVDGAAGRGYGSGVIRVLWAAWLLGILWLVPDMGWAQAGADCRANPHLSRAKDEYDRLEFDRAARTLQRAIEYSRNCKWDLAEIYRLKGFVDAVNSERERCQRAFEILLALDPQYSMPANVPPKIRSCFEDALQVAPARRTLAIDHTPPGPALPNAPVAIDVRVVDPLRLVDKVQVFFRREGVNVFTVVAARADEEVSVVIPALSVAPGPEAYAMEYFVRAVDRWDGTMAEAGSIRNPLVFRVQEAKTSKAFYEKWWFWGIVGTAAVGGGVAAAAAIAASGDETTLGITVAGPQPAP